MNRYQARAAARTCSMIRLCDGVDSYVVGDGLIQAQTVHCTLTLAG